MPIRPLVLALLAALTAAATAQLPDLVTNGSFTGTLAPWITGGGFVVNANLETGWNTTGLGASDSFGCQPGGQVAPAPYPPNTLEQSIFTIAGLTYELRADLSAARPGAPTVGNADLGTVWAEVNGVEVARVAFGGYNPGDLKRAQLSGRFTATTTGFVQLVLFFQRTFLANTSTPRINIDNVSVLDTAGPTFRILGNRKLGTSVTFAVDGDPNDLFGTFVAAAQQPGIAIPGIGGTFMLDLASNQTLLIGLLDANGQFRTTVTVPNLPQLTLNPFYYQAARASGASIDIGRHFGVVFTQ